MLNRILHILIYWSVVISYKHHCSKCPYSQFFQFVFSCIRAEYGEIRSISPYSVRMHENADQKNSEYGYFSPQHIISSFLHESDIDRSKLILSVCNFQSMKSSVEFNILLSKFFCYMTWLLYQLIRRDTGRLANEAFTSNLIVSSKQQLNGLKITNCCSLQYFIQEN